MGSALPSSTLAGGLEGDQPLGSVVIRRSRSGQLLLLGQAQLIHQCDPSVCSSVLLRDGLMLVRAVTSP